MSGNQQDANKKYLNSILGGDENVNKDATQQTLEFNTDVKNNNVDDYVSDMHYTNVDLELLPAGKFYAVGTKIKIRAAKVNEIQAYSVVDDKNFLDITDKMNEILSKNIIFIFPNGSKGSYKDIKDSDRIFLIFMIRELTFQGGNTLTKKVQCSCGHKFDIPFRSTNGKSGVATFDFHQPSDKIARFFKKNENVYEIIHNNVSWKLAPPTIGIQECFYDEIKRNVQNDIKPDVAFMKVTPFLLYNRNHITEDGIKSKMDDFNSINDLKLSQAINSIINNMTIGIKGLKMNCPQCGLEVRTDLTFPNGASTLFDIPDILDQF